jgi:hypothetical protein
MQKLYFINKGQLPKESFTLMGASVKSENSIGHFGTGLKYAVSVLLRTGGEIKITSGGEHFEFSTGEVSLKGVSFQAVVCNNTQLGYTTEYGKDWEGWQAYRELYCNAVDEGGQVTVDSMLAETYRSEGHTVIEVQSSLLWEAHLKKADFILDKTKELVGENSEVSIYLGSSNAIFYQGIKVASVNSAYTYNIKHKLTLTEDRTAADMYMVRNLIGIAAAGLSCRRHLLAILTPAHPCFERDLIYYNCQPTVEAATIVRHATRAGKEIPASLIHASKAVVNFNPIPVEFNPRQLSMLTKALAVLAGMNYQLTDKITLVASIDDTLFGQADIANQEIFLTAKAFEHGLFELVATLLEEHAHIVTGSGDFTRQFQDWLLRQILIQANLDI